ncbi:hypothetical protein HDU84_005088 [Entophlyctis sp. JEL0112]|nr:hypothetical protein HDU84_005088 [Entophlyctis sp. JEL0112]
MKVDFEDEINVSVTSDLKRMPLFRECDTQLSHSLALKLNPVQYRQGERVVVKGEIATEMYFVVSGVAEVFSEGNKVIFAEFAAATFFGEVGIFLEVKRIASVRAQTSTMTAFKLSKADLDEVLIMHPEIKFKIQAEAKLRFEQNLIREKSKMTNTQEAVTEIDIPLFKSGSQSFFHELAMALILRIFKPKEIIINADEPGSSMFFVADGLADVVSKDGKITFGEFGASTFFGEVSLFYVTNRTATIRARTVCNTLELHKDSLKAILEQHGSFAGTMLTKAEENYRLAIERQRAVKILQESEDSNKFTIEDTIERLSKFPTFMKTNPNFIRTVALHTSVHRFYKGEMICKKGEIANDMYFIVSGMVEIVSDDSSKVFHVAQDGGFFGEVELLRGIARTASVRIATNVCDVIQLTRQALERVLNELPDSYQSIAIEADKRLQQIDSTSSKAPDILRKFITPFSKKSTKVVNEVSGPPEKKMDLNLMFKSTEKDNMKVTTNSTASNMSMGSTFDEPLREKKLQEKGKFGKMLGKVFGMKEPSKVGPVSPIAKPTKDTAKKVQHIHEIPTGILAAVLQHLNPKERLKLRSVSHKFNSVLSDSRCRAELNCAEIFSNLDPEIFHSLCEKAPDQLITVDVTNCWQLLDDELGIMTNFCPNIQNLCISNCWKITDRGISYIAYGLTKLKNLDVGYCGQLKGFGFVDRRWVNLQSLNMTHCKQIGDEQLEKILANASEIEVVKMRRCIRLTDFGVFLLIRHCRKIRMIDLSDCDHVSDKCLKWIASSPSKLTDLRISFWTHITNAGLYDLSLGNHTFEILDLSHCQQIADAVVVFFSDIVKHLRILHLRRCKKITDGVAGFMAKNAVKLQLVDFTGCPLITPAAKLVLLQAFPSTTAPPDIPRIEITDLYTSGPKDMGKNQNKKKRKEEKKGRKKSTGKPID